MLNHSASDVAKWNTRMFWHPLALKMYVDALSCSPVILKKKKTLYWRLFHCQTSAFESIFSAVYSCLAMALRLPLRSLSRGIFTSRSLRFAPVSAVTRFSYATLAEVNIAFSVWRYFIFESCENDLSQNHNVRTESAKLNLKMILWLCYENMP